MRVKEQGITLIALIITVVVLTILAAVSLQALTDDGVVEQVKEETQKQQDSMDSEKTKMDETMNNQMRDWGF